MIGIYIIKCNANNKVYIGQSINLKNRLSGHRYQLKKGIHENSHLQNAFNKYGEKCFNYDILEIVDEKDYTKEKLNLLEIKYISLFNSANRDFGYNLDLGGNGKGRASKETCEKLSKAMKGKFVGRKMSEETKSLMSKNNARYWLGKHFSEETKKLLSNQRKGKPSHLKGKKQSIEHIQKRTDCQNGKIWINNGIEENFITPIEAKELLNNGFVYGRLFKKRVKGKKYNYNGGLYTIPQIAEMCGIDKTILFGRIRNGWTIEKATTTNKIPKSDKKGKHFFNGEYLNLTYISKLVGIDYEVLRSRIRRGYTLENAIKKGSKK